MVVASTRVIGRRSRLFRGISRSNSVRFGSGEHSYRTLFSAAGLERGGVEASGMYNGS